MDIKKTLSFMLKPNETRKFFVFIWVIVLVGPTLMMLTTIGDEKTKQVEVIEGSGKWTSVPDGQRTIIDLFPYFLVSFGGSLGLYIFVGFEEEDKKRVK